MRTILLIIFSLSVFADNKCLKEYKADYDKKLKKYHKAYKRYQERRRNAQSAIIGSQIGGQLTGGALVGSAILQNDRAPLKSDYNIFEDQIIDAVSFNLDSEYSLRPKLLDLIYDEASEKNANINYKMIQNYILKGLSEDKFCSFFGKSKPDRVKRYVLRELKKGDYDLVFNREPSVIDQTIEIETDAPAVDETVDMNSSNQ